MGDFLDGLKASRYAPVAIKQRFRVEYNEARTDVFAFFESTDDVTFYRRQIVERMRPGGRLRTYLCGNKQSVWYQYEQAEQAGKLVNAVFFVDKDIDDLTGHALPARQHIFVTDYYAVENYICTEEAVASVLEELIFLPDEQDSYRHILQEFRTGFEELATYLRPLFSEAVLLRRRNEVVSFNDFGDGLSPCFKMQNLRANPLSDWPLIFRTRCKYDDATVPPAALKAVEVELATKPHHEWMRGKFALWFFLQFIESLWLTLVGKQLNDRKKIRKTINLKPDNVFVAMQGKHPQPKNLRAFLAANIAGYEPGTSSRFAQL